MKLEQYVHQEREIRGNVHCHDGVWWKRTALQCCQPVFPLQEIRAGVASPSRRHALMRVSHLVPEGSSANSRWACLFLEGDRLSEFRFEKLKHEKRKAINRGHRSGLVVREIRSLEEHWRDLQEIYVSTARRIRYGLPPEYYIEKEVEWRTGLTREFRLEGRDWYGVFHGDKLLAFLYSCVVDDTASLLVTKYNSEFELMRPSDALHFHVLSHYRDLAGCRRVFAGRSISSVPTIDRFKASFGFERALLGAYEWTNPVAVAAGRAALRMERHLPDWAKVGALSDRRGALGSLRRLVGQESPAKMNTGEEQPSEPEDERGESS